MSVLEGHLLLLMSAIKFVVQVLQHNLLPRPVMIETLIQETVVAQVVLLKVDGNVHGMFRYLQVYAQTYEAMASLWSCLQPHVMITMSSLGMVVALHVKLSLNGNVQEAAQQLLTFATIYVEMGLSLNLL